jgi:hypothetical protein
MELGSRVRTCVRGCAGELQPVPGGSVDTPDFWVRRRERPGGWWGSTIPPVGPFESAARLVYRCAACRATHRLIDLAPAPRDLRTTDANADSVA